MLTMHRDSLEQLLSRGLSLAEIGRRFDRHESTVAYWMQKYGLEAVNRTKHAPKGGMDLARLESLIREGMSIGEIAEAVGRSKATVRHWLRKLGLTTRQADRLRTMNDHQDRLLLDCSLHGRTVFRRRPGGGYRCLKCRSAAVARRRRRIKEILVAEAGGACSVCGYHRYVGALQFHHLYPPGKTFSLGQRGVARSLAKARREVEKCVLLCSNCHAEIESGARDLPGNATVQCSSVLSETDLR
jgi:transposase